MTSNRRALVALAIVALFAIALGGVVVVLHRHDIRASIALAHSRSYKAGATAFDQIINRPGMGTSPRAQCTNALRLAHYNFPGYSASTALAGCLATEHAFDE